MPQGSSSKSWYIRATHCPTTLCPRPLMKPIARYFVATFSAAAVLTPLFAVEEAHACQACGCGDVNFQMQPNDPRAHTLHVAMNAASRGERYGTGYPWSFHEWRADLNLGWSYERTSLTLRMPWLWRSVKYEGMQTERTSGPGDIEIAASYQLTKLPDPENVPRTAGRARGWQAAVHLGLSIPTAPLAVEQTGQPMMDDVQSGSGSFMPFGGVTWAVGLNGFRIDGRHTAYIPAPGRFWFQVGPTLQQSVGITAEPFDQFRFGTRFYTSWAAPITVDGEHEEDTGGFAGYIDLEAEIQPHQQVIFVVGGRFPVIQRLRGDHRAEMGAYFGVRFQQAFRKKEEPLIL